MKLKQYDLDFKKMIVAKGKEIGNITVSGILLLIFPVPATSIKDDTHQE